MKFLIDAQLSKKLVSLFQDLNQEAIHTLDLPKQNTTQDVRSHPFNQSTLGHKCDRA